MIRLLLQVWELIAWIEAFQYGFSLVLSRLLNQPKPQPPNYLLGFSKPLSANQYSFYSPAEFAFVDLIEANWKVISSELERLDDKQIFLWKKAFFQESLGLFELYTCGRKNEKNCRLCPETTHLVERIPNLETASFSVLAPITHTAISDTKCGYGVLRCHLGLFTPDQSGIQIEGMSQAWSEGKCLMFNSTVKHEMWNWSDRPHAILLIDFKAPAELVIQQRSN